ncbi:aKG-HExxH-type peptide beta-hydroxylase [Streptomyces sp. NPDC008001]|uniref:aKG-HExxH-type peptide beta-hydroxylase n=1 Tax=Streptomyces sp. NPDC008001 TaxID=3364804 RepID=UPI0036F055C7
MDVEPDPSSAQDDQEALRRLLLKVVAGTGLPGPAPHFPLPLHPAAVEAVHRAQRERRSGTYAPERTEELVRQLARRPAAEGAEPVDPEGQDHLRRSLSRALAQRPDRPGGDGTPVTAALGTWSAADRAVLAEALGLLGTVWPRMLGELRAVVAQVALLDGMAIDGYTDFTVHGAVLINRRRLAPARSGLPGAVRLAEALVHEGTHNRCNAAAVREPFLTSAADACAGPLATPLRADPRPLSGLFQQTVVLARCVRLYGRAAGAGTAMAPAAAAGPDTAAAAAVRARHDRLLRDLRAAVATLEDHRAGLTEHGRRLLDRSARVAARG